MGKNTDMYTFYLFIQLVCFLGSVTAHGNLAEPAGRASAWRYLFDSEGNPTHPIYHYDQHWCAFLRKGEVIPNPRNVTCGIACQVYPYEPYTVNNRLKGLRSFEYGSEMYNLIPKDKLIVKTYKSGQIIKAHVQFAANHLGTIEFRICRALSNGADPDMDCFERQKLTFVKNRKTVIDIVDADECENYVNNKPDACTFSVKLPNGETCEHCLFQMNWSGSGQTKQQYISVADIRVV